MFYETLWTFRTANFKVELSCTDEPDPDLSWADEETLEKLESGEFVNVMFRVRVLGPNGEELGSDYLGNSVYSDVSEFRREHVGAQGRYGSYFRDMVSEAIREARRELRELHQVRVRETADA